MGLAEGEYTFVCLDCKGKGQIEIAADEPDHPDHDWVTCDDCNGEGEVVHDTEEAQERIDLFGDEPLRVRLWD